VPVVAGGLEPATYHNVSNTSAPVVTISASGANAGYVNLWEIPVWSSDSSFIDTNATNMPYFWYIMLKARQKEIYDAQTGSAQAHIYPRHIEEMSVGEIDEVEMVEYEETASPFFREIGKNLIENERLIKLRDTLLPELLNGRVDVSNIDI
jgi:putative type I site-specific deoxyribonuclease